MEQINEKEENAIEDAEEAQEHHGNIRGYSVDVGVVEVTEKGKDGKKHQTLCEIDFVVNDGMNKYYIQSALNIDDENKEKTELRPLLATKDFFKKIIITKSRMKAYLR